MPIRERQKGTTATATPYAFAEIDQVETPALVWYLDLIDANLDHMLRIAGGPARLRPHCKTHKTTEIIQRLVARGVTRHKCATLAEAELLATSGAEDVFIAYPMVGPSPADPHTPFMNSVASVSNSPYSVPHLIVDSFALSLRIVERTDSFSFAFSRYAAAPEFDETFRVWHDWAPVPPLPFHIATRIGWNPTAAARPLIEMLQQRIRRLSDEAPA